MVDEIVLLWAPKVAITVPEQSVLKELYVRHIIKVCIKVLATSYIHWHTHLQKTLSNM